MSEYIKSQISLESSRLESYGFFEKETSLCECCLEIAFLSQFPSSVFSSYTDTHARVNKNNIAMFCIASGWLNLIEYYGIHI